MYILGILKVRKVKGKTEPGSVIPSVRSGLELSPVITINLCDVRYV
jgi:hypothetical protein